MNKFTILFWSGNSCIAEFQSSDDSWLETSYVKLTEGAMIFSYDHNRSKKNKNTVSFTHNPEGGVKEFFNINTMMVSES